jgi:hypothetical protein
MRQRLVRAGALSLDDVGFLEREVNRLVRYGAGASPRHLPVVLVATARRLQRRFGPRASENEAQTIEELLSVLRKAGRGGTKRPSSRWGRMEEVDGTSGDSPALLVRSPSFRAGYIGSFRYPHRALLTSDGRAGAIRGRLMRERSGSVLIDCSGSMSVSLEDVVDVVSRLPAVTIAAYASCQDDYSRGRLVVLARGGRIAHQGILNAQLLGKGNIVDGEALRWLGCQPAPRVWVSDGVVTGVGDAQAANLDREAAALVREFGIRRFPTFAEYLRDIGNRT